MALKIDKLQGTVTIGSKRLSTSDVEALIHDLAEARNEMLPPVPATLKEAIGQRVLHMTEPAMAIDRDPDVGDIRLSLRHQGYGWVCFVMPIRQATFLRDTLTKRIGPVLVEVLDESHPQDDSPQH